LIMDALTIFALASFGLIVIIFVAALIQIKRESDPLGLSSLGVLLIVAAVTWYHYPSISGEANSFVQDLANGYTLAANHRPFYQAIGFSAYIFGIWLFLLAFVRIILKQGVDRFLGTFSGGVLMVGCGYVLSSYSSGNASSSVAIVLFMIVLSVTIMINCVKWYRTRKTES